MKISNYSILYVLIFFFIYSSCSKEELVTETTEVIIEEPKEIIANTIAGVLNDFNSEPIPGVEVKLFHKTEHLKTDLTDDQGKYSFETDDIQAAKLFLTYEKPGYSKIVRQINATSDAQVVNVNMAEAACVLEEFDEPSINFETEYITISGFAFQENGEPATNNYINIFKDFQDDDRFSNSGFIDQNGYWQMIVPKDIELILATGGIFAIDCSTSNDGQRNLGPYSEDVQIDNLQNIPSANLMSFNIHPLTCEGEKLTYGIVEYFRNGYNGFTPFKKVYFSNTPNEGLEFCRGVCDADMLHGYLAYDGNTNTYAKEERPFDSNQDFGQVNVCIPLESELHLWLDGVQMNVSGKNVISHFIGIAPYSGEKEGVRISPIFFGEEDKFHLNASLTGKLEIGKSYVPLVDVNVHKSGITYGNFEGTVTIDNIENEYAIGKINGTVYKSNEDWPYQQNYEPTPYELTGDFKILVF